MKRFLLVLVLLMFAGSVFAAELKITGDAFVRGSWNSAKVKGADRQHAAFYDYDFNLNAALKANDAATVYLKLTYDRDVKSKGTVADSDPNSVLSVERAYINYKFAPFLQLNTGLMAGGQWASEFGNDESNVMRVQFIGALSKDMIFIATVQKNNENGGYWWDTGSASEKNEGDALYLASRLQFGNITVLPLLTYITDKTKGKRINQYAFTLGLNGDFGMVGLESEFMVAMVDSNDLIKGMAPLFNQDLVALALYMGTGNSDAKDPVLFSAYVNVFAKPVDNIKAGVALAYASSHKKSGTSAYYGGDFDFTMVVDDWGWGSEGGLPGMMAFKPYVEVKVLPKLTVDAAFAYGVQADKKVMKYDVVGPTGLLELAGQAKAAYEASGNPLSAAGVMVDAEIGKELSFWEIDLGATWAFDDNTSYRLAAGYAGMEADKAKTQDFRIEHKFKVTF